VAVSTAGGGSLDSIIVDTPSTGKQCIEFLRQHNIGRCNFIALDKTTRFQAGLEKTRVFKKKPAQWVFFVFFVFFCFFIYICPEKREFLGFFQFQKYF
jgi:chromosome segregation ATPase